MVRAGDTLPGWNNPGNDGDGPGKQVAVFITRQSPWCLLHICQGLPWQSTTEPAVNPHERFL